MASLAFSSAALTAQDPAPAAAGQRTEDLKRTIDVRSLINENLRRLREFAYFTPALAKSSAPGTLPRRSQVS